MKRQPHRIFLFTLVTGKRRLGYGTDPEHARRIMAYRMSPEEMADLTEDEPELIRQQDLQQYVKDLG